MNIVYTIIGIVIIACLVLTHIHAYSKGLDDGYKHFLEDNPEYDNDN